MKWHLLLVPVSFCFIASQVRGEPVRPVLTNGVVSYEENGQRREIRVGMKCADLWVSPDESVIAFIGIEKSQPATGGEVEPFIEESSIYIARRADHFKPVRLAVRVEIGGRTWKVVRQPKVSPDRSTICFLVPYTMTTWKLVRTTIPTGRYTLIADATDYCVVWGGEHSGALILLTRHYSEPTANNPAPGVSYPCSVRTETGRQTKLADECSGDFDKLASRWSREHGGACH